MSMAILGWSIIISQILLALAMACATVRILIGPRAQDRVLALDALYVSGKLLMLTFGIRTGSVIYFDVALLIAVLGFVGTAAFAKFLMRGEVIE